MSTVEERAQKIGELLDQPKAGNNITARQALVIEAQRMAFKDPEQAVQLAIQKAAKIVEAEPATYEHLQADDFVYWVKIALSLNKKSLEQNR